ncbi:hypothetical protein F5Y12DRAFT_773730 [Xylaria sp. FL1777]|nr:hypothetical protein F5Y12DRAFT_773730 [Xylaria sp. FL1777]
MEACHSLRIDKSWLIPQPTQLRPLSIRSATMTDRSATMTDGSAVTAEPTQGDLETFGRALDDIGVSTLNPNQFLNNCVSVSISKLLAYRDVHEFWHDTLHGDLPDTSLTFPQIKNLISKTGWEFKWQMYTSSNKESAYSKMRPIRSPEYPNAVFSLVMYTRLHGVAHCVVSGAWHDAVETDLNEYSHMGFKFTCYQRDQYGINVLPEVKAAQKIIVIHLRCPHNTSQHEEWIDRTFWRMIERRRDPVLRAKRLKIVQNAIKLFGLTPLTPSEEETLYFSPLFNSRDGPSGETSAESPF